MGKILYQSCYKTGIKLFALGTAVMFKIILEKAYRQHEQATMQYLRLTMENNGKG